MYTIYNIDYCYDRVLLVNKDQVQEHYYNITLDGLSKENFISLLKILHGYGMIFEFKFPISYNFREITYTYFDSFFKSAQNNLVHKYISPSKIWNHIDLYSGNYLIPKENLYLDYFMEKWKKDQYEEDFIAKIEKIYNDFIIKNIIE